MLKNSLRPLLTRLKQACAGEIRRERRSMGSRTSRRFVDGRDVATEAIVLETRALLAAGLGFDFTTIASDLSATDRFFGSASPADAPFTILRYGFGYLRSPVFGLSFRY